ncbi:hypothetical protein SARC_00420 [Sphaeroforma arctica JP610]|uniref:Right handed beta helix domain-containing protein n=1 Tax=Sphaeroforma arctica JP610 TaxID=667725 RepID=A0A0L0GF43_9EUKA|nr:hypothetical protein SARC_00420 [Sphaeroforma arctica JP610]KNC87486.1 hypothetical protein SARC_00420 [Sphaeroforma arctica JP610]|eukprot:XP_014161388.1 hypothetical protein SARC_00420 [Sphaeroforma arctica JP610]
MKIKSFCGTLSILVLNLIDSTSAVSDPCECTSLVLQGGKCQDSFSQAVSDNNGVIHFAGTHEIASAMRFRGDLDVRGVECDNEGRAKIIGAYSSESNGMFSPQGPSRISISFQGFDITSKEGEFVSALRTSGGEGDSGEMYVTFRASDIRAYGMWNKRLGAVFFIGNIGGLAGESRIDDSCMFWDNKIESTQTELYHGGAVLCVQYIEDKAELYVGGEYKGNTAFYTGGSKHCTGGAVYIDTNEGSVITGKKARFEDNVSNQGGAISINSNVGSIDFQSTFKANKALDQGEGARAGAVRVFNLGPGSTTILSGEFIDNLSDVDGGVMATNIIGAGAHLVFSGVFSNNTSLHTGAVMSQWSQYTNEGLTQVLASAKVYNNTATYDMRSNLFKFTSGPSLVSEEDLVPGVTWSWQGSKDVPVPEVKTLYDDTWKQRRRRTVT